MSKVKVKFKLKVKVKIKMKFKVRVKVRVIFMVLGTYIRCPENFVKIIQAGGSGQVLLQRSRSRSRSRS